MKRRWPFVPAIAGCLIVGLGWLARPVEPQLPPEFSGQLTVDKRLPHAFSAGTPPPGTAWEMYVIPVAYSRLNEAMKGEPGWRVTKGEFMGAKTRAMYRSTDAERAAGIDVLPGRFMIVDSKKPVGLPDQEDEYSSVVVASPTGGSLWKTFVRWVDRFSGRTAPSLPKGHVLVYMPPSPEELTRAIGQPSRVSNGSKAKGMPQDHGRSLN